MRKEKQLTQEQIDKKNTLKLRMFYLLVGVDILLVIYLIYQIVSIFFN